MELWNLKFIANHKRCIIHTWQIILDSIWRQCKQKLGLMHGPMFMCNARTKGGILSTDSDKVYKVEIFSVICYLISRIRILKLLLIQDSFILR